ncbi:MAG: tetratricopeptide repeat protein, partial [Chloroflexi bacterium]|nr:tetratricopeptide repeat protein [Chloroflexota bacterium]
FQRETGRLPLAVLNYVAALEHQPAQLLARDRAKTLRNLGRAYAGLERYDEARDVWTEALELSQELPDESPQEIALTHHAIGEAYRSQGHYRDAEMSLREALHHHSDGNLAQAETLRALGQTMHAAGRPEAAIQPLKDALDIEKAQSPQSNARLVNTLRLLADAQESRHDLSAAVARHHEALVYMDRRTQPVPYADTLRTLGRLYHAQEEFEAAHKAYAEALEIENDHVPRSDERVSATLQAIATVYRDQGDLERAAEYYQQVTGYANYSRRATDDLRETLDELERRRAMLQAAQQSLTLLDRSDNTGLKDLVFIMALIARSYANLNQPQTSAEAIHNLLDSLAEYHDDLDTDAEDPDLRALAWLDAAADADRSDDVRAAQRACNLAHKLTSNDNLRWVIEQFAQSLSQN